MRKVNVKEVNTEREMDDFVGLTERLYAGSPYYVPDMETDIGGLTLLVLGKMSLAESMMLNRVRVRRTTPFMEGLLIRRPTFLYDSF